MSEHTVPAEEIQTSPAVQSTDLELIPRRGGVLDLKRLTLIKRRQFADFVRKRIARQLTCPIIKEYEDYEKFRDPAVQDKPKAAKVSGKTYTQQILASP